MEQKSKISEGKLLYDPMFVNRPAMNWKDSEKGWIFGKSITKKILFIVVLLVAIGGSMFFSFDSLSKDKYEFEDIGNGYRLNAFHGQKYDTVLNIDYVRDENSVPDMEKPVTDVRKFTTSGNDSLQFIFIGKDVNNIEKTAFYYCTALSAVFVDKDNETYADIDGVLYKKENGIITEAVLCPQRYSVYLAALNEGFKAPENEDEAKKLAEKFSDEATVNEYNDMIADENYTAGKKYKIPDTVKIIDQLCFAFCDKFTDIELPESLEVIETMAFYSCKALKSIELPDGVVSIGSDAFSKCAEADYIFIPSSVKEIGHNAFWECQKAEKVYMEASDLEGVETGHDWLPQYRKTFLKDREIVFSAERGVK